MPKSIDRYLLIQFFFVILFFACGNKNTFEADLEPIVNFDDTNRMCSEFEIELLLKSGEGDFRIAQSYLDAGGDPNLSCVCNSTVLENDKVFKAAPVSLSRRILISIASDDDIYPLDSSSFLFILYYLTFDLSDETKSEYLNFFLGSNSSQGQLIAKALVNKGAKFQHQISCYYESIDDYRELGEIGYDFNLTDAEKNGKTILMELAECPCDKVHRPEVFDTIDTDGEYAMSLYDFRGYNSAAEIIEIMKVLIQYGARTDIKDYDGNSLLDLAVNQEIVAFVKSLNP